MSIVSKERKKYGNGAKENATEKELDQWSGEPGAQGLLHADEQKHVYASTKSVGAEV